MLGHTWQGGVKMQKCHRVRHMTNIQNNIHVIIHTWIDRGKHATHDGNVSFCSTPRFDKYTMGGMGNVCFVKNSYQKKE